MLDERVRQDMANELLHDTASNKTYNSPLLNDDGCEWYPSLLMDAARSFDEIWLADELIKQKLVAPSEPVGPDGTETQVQRVMVERFARQEFNRLHARAICRFACDEGKEYVEVYRAEQFPNAPLAVQQLVHTPVDAAGLLTKLRNGRSLE